MGALGGSPPSITQQVMEMECLWETGWGVPTPRRFVPSGCHHCPLAVPKTLSLVRPGHSGVIPWVSFPLMYHCSHPQTILKDRAGISDLLGSSPWMSLLSAGCPQNLVTGGIWTPHHRGSSALGATAVPSPCQGQHLDTPLLGLSLPIPFRTHIPPPSVSISPSPPCTWISPSRELPPPLNSIPRPRT